MDIASMLERLEGEGRLASTFNDPRSQFITNNKRYLGATFLPEKRIMEDGAYREHAVKWTSIVATDSTRYSPVGLRQAARGGSVLVELGEKDAGAQIFGRELEQVRRALNNGRLYGADSAESLLARFSVSGSLVPLLDKAEKERWEAMVDGQIIRAGDNGYGETVPLANPVGHRVNVTDEVDDPAVNPMEAVAAQLSFMAGKGYTVNRIVTSTRLLRAILNNPSTSKALYGVRDPSGEIWSGTGMATLGSLNSWMGANGYPAIEVYDGTYDTLFGRKRFLRDDAMLFVATNPVPDEAIRALSATSLLPEATSLGYYGIGIAENQSEPGRVVIADYYDRDRGARISVKGWETSAPVILQPESLSTLYFQYTA